MVSTAVSRASSSKGFEYVMNEQKGEEISRNGLYGSTPNDLEREFKGYAQNHTRLQNNQINIILSPDKNQSNLNIEDLRELTEKHLKNLGLENQPYIACVHSNTPDKHIHILVSRADGSGKLVSDSYIGNKSFESANKLSKDYYQFTAKQSVQVEKLRLKNEINNALDKSPNIEYMNLFLSNKGIYLEPIYRRKTNEIQGFKVHSGKRHFKLSEVDRNLSRTIKSDLLDNKQTVLKAFDIINKVSQLNPNKVDTAVLKVLESFTKHTPIGKPLISAIEIINNSSNPLGLAKNIINAVKKVQDIGMHLSR